VIDSESSEVTARIARWRSGERYGGRRTRTRSAPLGTAGQAAADAAADRTYRAT
jgi:hypothetical protein